MECKNKKCTGELVIEDDTIRCETCWTYYELGDDIGVIEKDGGDWEDMVAITFTSQEWKDKFL